MVGNQPDLAGGRLKIMELITWVWYIVGGLGAAALAYNFLGVKMVKGVVPKPLKEKKMAWLAALLLVMGLLGLGYFGGFSMLAGIFPFTATGGGAGTGGQGGVVTSAPTLTITGFDALSSGTSIGTGSFKYRKVGDKAWQTGAYGTAITSSYGTVYQVLHMAGNTTWYGKLETVTITEPIQTHEVPIYSIATAASMSAAYQNSDGSVNSVSNAQALAAGDVKTLKLQVTGHYKKAYGAPSVGDISGTKDNMIVFEYNGSEVDSVTYAAGSSIGRPQQATVSATANEQSAYTFPVLISTADTGFQSVVVDADDSINPTATGGDAGRVNATIYDMDIYQIDNAGYANDQEPAAGVENNKGTDVGLATELTADIYYS